LLFAAYVLNDSSSEILLELPRLTWKSSSSLGCLDEGREDWTQCLVAMDYFRMILILKDTKHACDMVAVHAAPYHISSQTTVNSGQPTHSRSRLECRCTRRIWFVVLGRLYDTLARRACAPAIVMTCAWYHDDFRITFNSTIVGEAVDLPVVCEEGGVRCMRPTMRWGRVRRRRRNKSSSPKRNISGWSEDVNSHVVFIGLLEACECGIELPDLREDSSAAVVCIR